MRMSGPRARGSTSRGRIAFRLPATRPPLRRLFWTLGQLRGGRPLKATDLAREFQVTVRTAYRDLDFLRDQLSTPVEYDRPNSTWRLTDPTAPLPPMMLSQGEVVALFFAEKVLAQYRGTPYEADAASAFNKLQSLMPEEVKVLPDRILPFLSLDLGPLPAGNPRVFATVAEALNRRLRLEVRYRSLSSGQTLDRAIDPYRLFNLKGDWYVAAFDHRRRTVRDFALHRIRRATLTGQPYEPDPGFDFNAYMADAFSIEKGGRPVNVTVRFAPRQARWIREKHWHRSARIQERLDGGCVLRMKVPVTSELRRWVMQFGDEAEVVGPRSFRDAIAQELRSAARAYAPGAKGTLK